MILGSFPSAGLLEALGRLLRCGKESFSLPPTIPASWPLSRHRPGLDVRVHQVSLAGYVFGYVFVLVYAYAIVYVDVYGCVYVCVYV